VMEVVETPDGVKPIISETGGLFESQI
jgi:hypothetical protein